MHKPGERVGVILAAEKGKIELLGFGEYLGEIVPERPIGLMATVFPNIDSWQALADAFNENYGDEYPDHEFTAENVKRGNPKIRLDSGVEVWGAETWWGPEAKVKDTIARAEQGGAEVIEVDARTVPGLQANEK
jgi:hypothetical protein